MTDMYFDGFNDGLSMIQKIIQYAIELDKREIMALPNTVDLLKGKLAV